MTTVPNWIAKAVVYAPSRGTTPASASPVTSWRATNTQVVVTHESLGHPVERRFRLDDLAREIGRPVRHYNRAYLLHPDDPRVTEAIENAAAESALSDLTAAVEHRPGTSASPGRDAAAVARYASAVRDAAAKALAELAEYL